MKLMLALYFFILAIIQMGLLFGIYHYYRSQNLARPNIYWMSSLTLSVLALLVFGGGIVSIEDIARPEFNFTIANTFFYAAAVLQAFFCQSLNREVGKPLKISLAISILFFIVVFEWLRNESTFEVRTVFICVLTGLFYVWQIIEVRIKRKKSPSSQLIYLQYASVAELFFALGRLTILIVGSLTIRQVEQIPQILILFTIAQLVMNTLSYIAIGSYWAEQIAFSNFRSNQENQEIKALLKERETLIGSLLKANKTASTGALSAAIAHELNQPLGASSLNIQFLQKKLSEGQLNPALEKEIFATLLSDNQRAAGIIRSLRSIFSDEKVGPSKIDLAELIEAVLSIAKPEITAKSIQIVLTVQPHLMIQANRGEIQQVLLNLVNNAIDALVTSSQRVKKLSIDAQHIEGGVLLTVADNGDGIPEASQKQLFELLSSSKSSGMGLGLWLCKHIITRHGGSIKYESNSGGGAKFAVRLPTNINPV
ncbi:HAMP domain-containing histidine kinase [Polynucleobacter sp. 86C-FISCH]|uniref:sensor histidine kinase n=1 Tax=Polynucleobacter sp. 86C-FISCH TaxID=2689101 RepID=UPI001C0CF043|nr:HAMP domain-containing sensor histidine kinase [Polynucleobacter sp. 86C-FISCH]MBU3596707.1 HAMP domain-containing histidine kinase [Polynucleobacter sp. 86C-FISCH]